MATWCFGDGFDCYQQFSDAFAGGTYWDSGNSANLYLVPSSAGRLSGSRGLINGGGFSSTTAALVKASGSNDAIHHINVAYYQTETGAALDELWLTLSDGTTAQCTICFQRDGSIILRSASTGATLATYSSAFAINTWTGFEFEVVVNNTTGSFKVRKNGNTSNDFSATGLNTRGGTANNYANKLSVGANRNAAGAFTLDDLLWRSDPSAVSWIGDVRCYTRLPASDAAAVWTRSGSVVPVTPYVQGGTGSTSASGPRYAPFTAACSGTLGSVVLSLNAGFTGNAKCTLFADNGSNNPGAILGSATSIVNPVLGNNTFTFGSPVSVTQGTTYWLGFAVDTVVASGWNLAASNIAGALSNSGILSATAYASFPVANPVASLTGAQAPIFSANITPTTAANANLVADPTQDGAGGYVYSANVGDADLYAPQATTGTPSGVVAVTTRALLQKSDAGTRNVGLQVKSGATTSTGTSTALNTSWGWIWRTDQTDPNTGAAWTPTAVNNVQFGPKVLA